MAQLIKIGNNYYSDFRQNKHRIRRMLSPDKDEAQKLLNAMLSYRKVSKQMVPAKPTDVTIHLDNPTSEVLADMWERYRPYMKGVSFPFQRLPKAQ